MNAQQLKLRGIDRVTSNNRAWMNQASFAVEALSYGMDEFTSDDVRAHCHLAPSHPNAWGALMSGMSHAGLIRRVGYRPSKLPSTRGRVVAVWKGV